MALSEQAEGRRTRMSEAAEAVFRARHPELEHAAASDAAGRIIAWAARAFRVPLEGRWSRHIGEDQGDPGLAFLRPIDASTGRFDPLLWNLSSPGLVEGRKLKRGHPARHLNFAQRDAASFPLYLRPERDWLAVLGAKTQV